MSSKELKISGKQANFLFRNLFAHDPSHDFNPSNGDRLHKLNALAERLFGQLSGGGIENNKTAKTGVNVEKLRSRRNESVQENARRRREQAIENAREDVSIDIDEEFLEISKYLGFEEDGVFHSLAKSNLSIIPNLCNSAGLEVEDMMGSILPNSGILTRGKARKRRQMIEFVQKQIDFNDRIRLYVSGFEGNELQPYEDDENAMDMSGGKLGADTNIIPRFIPLQKDIPSLKNELVKEDSLEDTFSKKLHIVDDAKTMPREKSDDSSGVFLTNVGNIFYTINNEILTYDGSSDEDVVQYKSQLQSIYSILEQSILFFHHYVDASLPIYAILNTFFVEETLFTCCLDTMLEPSKAYFSSEDSPEDQYNKFKSIYNLHYLEVKDANTQRGGGGLSDMFNEFQKELPLKDIIDTEMKKFQKSKTYDLNGLSESFLQHFETFFTDMDIGELEIKFRNLVSSRIQKHDSVMKEHVARYHNLKTQNARTVKPRAVKDNNVDDEFKESVTKIYDSVMGGLKKIMKDTLPVGFFNKSNIKKMSLQGKIIANKFLQTLCSGVLENTRAQYVQTRQDRSDGFEGLYETERESLKHIADEGSTRTDLDSSLLEKFNELVRKKYPNHFVKIMKHNASEDLYNRYKNKKMYVINNAMNKKIVNELYLKQNIELLCPISSVIDAQGQMGSCSKGRKSSNFISSPIDISIEGPGMEMGITMPLSKKKGQYILTYYASYGDLFISDSEINAIISEGTVNILSANNTFKSLLEHIELTFQNGDPTWETFKNKEQLSKIIRIISKKMMGDFLQELNAILENGGFAPLVPQYNNKSHILLTNGDQPSTVRAAYLLLHDETEGINPNAAVTFITTSKGFLYRKNTLLGGGNKKKTAYRRTRKKGQKTTKTKKTTLKHRRKNK